MHYFLNLFLFYFFLTNPSLSFFMHTTTKDYLFPIMGGNMATVIRVNTEDILTKNYDAYSVTCTSVVKTTLTFTLPVNIGTTPKPINISVNQHISVKFSTKNQQSVKAVTLGEVVTMNITAGKCFLFFLLPPSLFTFFPPPHPTSKALHLRPSFLLFLLPPRLLTFLRFSPPFPQPSRILTFTRIFFSSSCFQGSSRSFVFPPPPTSKSPHLPLSLLLLLSPSLLTFIPLYSSSYLQGSSPSSVYCPPSVVLLRPRLLTFLRFSPPFSPTFKDPHLHPSFLLLILFPRFITFPRLYSTSYLQGSSSSSVLYPPNPTSKAPHLPPSFILLILPPRLLIFLRLFASPSYPCLLNFHRLFLLSLSIQIYSNFLLLYSKDNDNRSFQR
ncbi:unnamed protein product [Acanthosepion pharaonis]|uniref:Uncharacterized protein n=1 Tax=Acanthosepion pharaonis TaxID=158019 RepID=A0A812CK28_ACAPH|nr:unnamed protein product [Sepia pharaonis]